MILKFEIDDLFMLTIEDEKLKNTVEKEWISVFYTLINNQKLWHFFLERLVPLNLIK